MAKMIETSKFSTAAHMGTRIAENLKNIRSVVCLWEQHVAEGGRMPKPAEWLTDNWYIAEREGKGAIHDLRSVKDTRAVDGKGKALVMYAAEELVHSGAGVVNAERMSIFLENFQKVIVLREKELSLFVPALKAALVAELARIAMESRALLKPKPKSEGGERCQSEHELSDRAGKVISSLRLMSSIDVSKILEGKQTDRYWGRPAGAPEMDDKTRITTATNFAQKPTLRRQNCPLACDLAKGGEVRKSCRILIFEKPLDKPRRKRSGGLYITDNVTWFSCPVSGFILESRLSGYPAADSEIVRISRTL